MLGNYPTPIAPLRRLRDFLKGPELWIKRDDLTGLALGGNKTRKLEYLMADAVASGADVVMTAGAQQSNHCRQTAAACAMLGLECHLVLGGSAPAMSNGNLLLDQLFGATIHWAGEDRKGESLETLAAEMRQQGRHPYLVPYGGSNAIGARGFVDAMAELRSQMVENHLHFDRIVFASSSGGTQAGLLVGARLHAYEGVLTGVSIDKGEAGEKPFAEHVADIANDVQAFTTFPGNVVPSDVNLVDGYVGEGYGVVGDLEREAIDLLASQEGILLDPVYTGRAMGALIDMIRRGDIKADESILFWHTGGAPALFPYAPDLRPSLQKESL